MKYAIAKIGGKQFKIKEGSTIKVESQSKPKFDVLAYSDGKNFQIGTPVITDVKVKAKVVAEGKDKKIRVARFRAKSRYDKVKGHRQPITVLKIEEISKKKEEKSSSAEK